MQTRFTLRVLGAATLLLLVFYIFSNPSTIAEGSRHLSSYASALRGGRYTNHGSDSRPSDEIDDMYILPPSDDATSPELSSQDEASIPLEDKVVVIGRLEKEDTSWVHENLPNWQNAIYTVDNTSAARHTPRNKGREANVYLLYIIQHYHKLPSTMVFLHAHRNGYPTAWHNDNPGYDNVIALQSLNIDFVQRTGYTNLRCNGIPGCPDEVQYQRESKDGDDEESNVEHKFPEVWQHFFGADSVVPEVVAAPCCAQFAVSREQVLKRSLDDYKRYHQWLMNTKYTDQVSGTIMEYMWHIIFGKPPVHCPELNQCYHDVYGR